MPHDFPLPINDQPNSIDQSVNHWPVEQQPTTLVGFWPGDAPPTQTEVLAGLQAFWGEGEFKQIDELEGTLWNGVFQTPLSVAPVILWGDLSRPLRLEDIDDPAVHACRWVVGIETLLHQPVALEQYTIMLRAMATLGCAAILDPVTQRFWESSVLDDLTCETPAVLSNDDLFIIHVVSADTSSTGTAWLHTHGLWRCGLPELEMMEVPGYMMNAAAEFIKETAEYVTDATLPPAGEPFEVGHHLRIALQPWEVVAPQVSQSGAGGNEDRKGEDNPHAGVRAVICRPEPKGLFRKHWIWPQDAVEAVERRQAIFFRSAIHGRRQAQRAQARWDDLATAFAASRAKLNAAADAACVFLIKAAIQADDGDPDHKEHVWFEVQKFDDEFAQAKLVSEPMFVKAMRAGTVHRVARGSVSDWGVQTRTGQFGPGDVPAMWRAIKSLGASP